jgi:hypothetical protein
MFTLVSIDASPDWLAGGFIGCYLLKRKDYEFAQKRKKCKQKRLLPDGVERKVNRALKITFKV